jgi:hypothetical protein
VYHHHLGAEMAYERIALNKAIGGLSALPLTLKLSMISALCR